MLLAHIRNNGAVAATTAKKATTISIIAGILNAHAGTVTVAVTDTVLATRRSGAGNPVPSSR